MPPASPPSASPFKLKLITDVATFGLLTPLARSRPRLIVSALVANALMIGATLGTADYINTTSTSVGLNLALITGAMLLLVVTSYIDAMLIGDLFFPGDFREDVLLGKKRDIDPESAEALNQDRYRSHNIAFLLTVAGALIANYFGVGALTGDWINDYHELGFPLTELRSGDAEARAHAWTELSKPLYKDLWSDPRLLEAVKHELHSDDPEARRLAAWGAGAMHMTSLYDDLTPLLGPPHDTDTRAAAAVALGKLNDPRATPLLQHALQSAADPRDTTLALGALRGAALSNNPELGPQVLPWIEDPDPDLRAHAYFAIMQLKLSDARPTLFNKLDKGAPDEQCGALEALKFTSTPEDVQRLKDRFLLLDQNDPACDEVLWIEPNGHKNRVVWKETHRVKLLKAIWNAAHGEQLEWFHTLAVDKDMPWPIRAQAADLVDIAKHESHLRR